MGKALSSLTTIQQSTCSISCGIDPVSHPVSPRLHPPGLSHRPLSLPPTKPPRGGSFHAAVPHRQLPNALFWAARQSRCLWDPQSRSQLGYTRLAPAPRPLSAKRRTSGQMLPAAHSVPITRVSALLHERSLAPPAGPGHEQSPAAPAWATFAHFISTGSCAGRFSGSIWGLLAMSSPQHGPLRRTTAATGGCVFKTLSILPSIPSAQLLK